MAQDNSYTRVIPPESGHLGVKQQKQKCLRLLAYFIYCTTPYTKPKFQRAE